MNAIPASSVGNSRIATGTIAIAGMGLANSVNGPNTSENTADRPSTMPLTTPTTAASPKPVMIRTRPPRGQPQAVQDPEQRLAKSWPVVLGAKAIRERRSNLCDGGQRVEPQPQ